MKQMMHLENLIVDNDQIHCRLKVNLPALKSCSLVCVTKTYSILCVVRSLKALSFHHTDC